MNLDGPSVGQNHIWRPTERPDSFVKEVLDIGVLDEISLDSESFCLPIHPADFGNRLFEFVETSPGDNDAFGTCTSPNLRSSLENRLSLTNCFTMVRLYGIYSQHQRPIHHL